MFRSDRKPRVVRQRAGGQPWAIEGVPFRDKNKFGPTAWSFSFPWVSAAADLMSDLSENAVKFFSEQRNAKYQMPNSK